MIWPPLILAGAIVFLLNPVVTRLQARRIPRALGTGLSYLAVVAITVLVVLLVAPLATRQYDELAEEWPELREDLEDDINDLVGALGGGRVADPDPHLAGARGPVLGRGRRRHQRRRRGERGGGAGPLRRADLDRSRARP